MAFGMGIGPRMGAMGQAAAGAGAKFTGQPAQTQQFGNMGPDARSTMGGMPPIGTQGALMGMQNPMGGGGQNMQAGIGPSNFQELLRKFMQQGQGGMQPMNGGIMGGGMPSGLNSGQQLFGQ